LLSPGVRLSVTVVDCIQTAKDIFRLLSRPSRPIIVVFCPPSAGTQFQGEPLQRGHKIQGCGKFFYNFRLTSPSTSITPSSILFQAHNSPFSLNLSTVCWHPLDCLLGLNNGFSDLVFFISSYFFVSGSCGGLSCLPSAFERTLTIIQLSSSSSSSSIALGLSNLNV